MSQIKTTAFNMYVIKNPFPLKCALYFTLCISAMLQSCRKDAKEMTKEEIIENLSDKKKYEAILEYARRSGISTDKFPADQNNAPVFGLLEEMAYGHKPHLRYTQKKLQADTALIRAVAEDLVGGADIENAVAKMEPPYAVYRNLEKHYVRLLQENKKDSAAVVAESLNAYRWIHRQARRAPRFVIVNLRGAYLKGMDSVGKNVISMRTVVGKIDTPTPTMDTYATSIVTHPYWNVPKSIALKEILPKAQRSREYLVKNNIAVIDSKGEAVDPEDINWDEMSAEKFPYRFRQETGEDNSLGLLKVEIKNPLAIYLHDTNARYLFASDQRWRSHGCVRVQHPTELANFMAGTQLLDSDFLTEPDTVSIPPKWHKLKQRIPVFLFYLGADCNENGQLMYFKDVYKRGAPGV
jgi:L,D-transpeptidase YcbB